MITEDKSKLFIKIAAAVLITATLWLFAAVTDYVMVVGLYRRPVFCLSATEDQSGGIYKGIGYSYIIKGNFGSGPDSPSGPYGVHYAEMDIFGFEAKVIYRGVHE